MGQLWHGLNKLSLENAGDISALHEGMAWQIHQLAANAGFYGPEQYPALASWVRVFVNGEYLGVYTNVEQRDTQFLRNRGIRVSGETWLYESCWNRFSLRCSPPIRSRLAMRASSTS